MALPGGTTVVGAEHLALAGAEVHLLRRTVVFTAMPKVVLVGSMPWSNLLQLSPPSVERRMPPSSLPKFRPTQA